MNWLEAINELKLPPLVSGNHSEGPEYGLCAMEMVAFMERLEHSDRPECTCQVIRDFVIATNDILIDTQRQKLLAVLPELVDTVVDARSMRDREQFITRTAMRDLQHVNRESYERDYERDRFRGFSHAAHMGAEIHHLLGSVGGAVKLMAKVHAPWHLADILIGVLREALKIGATQPKTQFKDPERVKELVEITCRPYKRAESKLTMMGTMPMSVTQKSYSFVSDCMV